MAVIMCTFQPNLTDMEEAQRLSVIVLTVVLDSTSDRKEISLLKLSVFLMSSSSLSSLQAAGKLEVEDGSSSLVPKSDPTGESVPSAC